VSTPLFHFSFIAAALGLVGAMACTPGGDGDGEDAGDDDGDAGVYDDGGALSDDDAGAPGTDAGSDDAGFVLDGPLIVGGARPVEVFVPVGADVNTPMPLVFFLHGYGVTGAVMESFLNIRTHAQARGFLYAHPEGRIDGQGSPFWNASQACCDFFQTGVDDGAYLRGLIDEIATRVAVDASRVYLIGHSNGGFMSYRMACDHADKIAAIVSVAGAMMNDVDVCAPTSTVAALQVHGTEDTTILYDGATVSGVTYPGARASAERWATKMGCSLDESVSPTPLDLDLAVAGAETTAIAFEDGCDEGGAAALYTIEGGSHTPTASSSFVPALLDFLFAHAKP